MQFCKARSQVVALCSLFIARSSCLETFDSPDADDGDGSGIAALSQVIGENTTLPDEMGLFSARTWRLPPSICKFASEQYYESRLQSESTIENHRIIGEDKFDGSGLRFFPFLTRAMKIAVWKKSMRFAES